MAKATTTTDRAARIAKAQAEAKPADDLLIEVDQLLKQKASWLSANVGCFLNIFGDLSLSKNHVSIRSPYSEKSEAYLKSPLAQFDLDNPRVKYLRTDSEEIKAKGKEINREIFKRKDALILSEINRVRPDLEVLGRKHGFRFALEGSTSAYLLPSTKPKTRRGYRRR
jgi:hypothetical protein